MWTSSTQQQDQQKAELRVYAGTSYDKSKLIPVPVNLETENNETLVDLESDLIKAKVAVRIQDYQVPNKAEQGSTDSTTTTTTVNSSSKDQIASAEGIETLFFYVFIACFLFLYMSFTSSSLS